MQIYLVILFQYYSHTLLFLYISHCLSISLICQENSSVPIYFPYFYPHCCMVYNSFLTVLIFNTVITPYPGWSVTASILFLSAIAGDRFFAIVYPLRAKKIRRWMVFLPVALIWISAAAVASPMLWSWQMTSIQWKDRHEMFCREVWPRYNYLTADGQCLTHAPGRTAYVTVNVVLLYFVPILVMSVAYSVIVYTLWRRKVPGESSESAKAVQTKTRRKVTLKWTTRGPGALTLCLN